MSAPSASTETPDNDPLQKLLGAFTALLKTDDHALLSKWLTIKVSIAKHRHPKSVADEEMFQPSADNCIYEWDGIAFTCQPS